jgi:uncharacterized protein involved in high-affinity Fe2+ transport
VNEIANSINQWGQAVLTVCGIVATVIATLAGSRWGKSKAVQTAADVAALIRELATVAVNATEQLYRKAPAPESADQAQALRSVKLDEARGKLLALLPEGVALSPAEADAAIEAAVHRLNEAKR